MYPVIPESDRPSDLADDCILSPDGVNPVSKNDEAPSEKNLFDDKIAVYPVPGATLPPSRCRAFLQLPRGIGNTADTD